MIFPQRILTAAAQDHSISKSTLPVSNLNKRGACIHTTLISIWMVQKGLISGGSLCGHLLLQVCPMWKNWSTALLSKILVRTRTHHSSWLPSSYEHTWLPAPPSVGEQREGEHTQAPFLHTFTWLALNKMVDYISLPRVRTELAFSSFPAYQQGSLCLALATWLSLNFWLFCGCSTCSSVSNKLLSRLLNCKDKKKVINCGKPGLLHCAEWQGGGKHWHK